MHISNPFQEARGRGGGAFYTGRLRPQDMPTGPN